MKRRGRNVISSESTIELKPQYNFNEEKMDFTKAVLLLFCVQLFPATLCSADDELDYRNEYEACIVRYLKVKGKLNETFELKVPPSSSCPVVAKGPHYFSTFDEPPTVYDENSDNYLQSLIKTQIVIEFPNIALCFINEFDKKEAIDYFMKIHMILRSDSVNDAQLNETRNDFKNVLKEISAQCVPDETNFIKIFSYVLGLKNDTLEDHQQEYCLAKYLVDNKLLEMKYRDINPHLIDSESVNCDHIIAVERSKIEKEFRDKLSEISSDQSALDSVMIDFNSHRGFDWLIAFRFLNYLDIPSQVREFRSDRFDERLERFVNSFEYYGYLQLILESM